MILKVSKGCLVKVNGMKSSFINCIFMLAAGILLVGCASTQRLPADATVPPAPTIPLDIREAPPGDLQFAEIGDSISAYTGSSVRWGGIIQAVDDKEQGMWLEIEEHGLDKYGKPEPGSPSEGRFIARISDSVDSEAYALGREITVAGQLEGRIEESMGKGMSSLPLVEAEEHYLWDRNDAIFFPGQYAYRYYPRRYYRYYPYYDYRYYPYDRFGFYSRHRYGHGYPYYGYPFGYGHYHGFHFGLHYGF